MSENTSFLAYHKHNARAVFLKVEDLEDPQVSLLLEALESDFGTGDPDKPSFSIHRKGELSDVDKLRWELDCENTRAWIFVYSGVGGDYGCLDHTPDGMYIRLVTIAETAQKYIGLIEREGKATALVEWQNLSTLADEISTLREEGAPQSVINEYITQRTEADNKSNANTADEVVVIQPPKPLTEGQQYVWDVLEGRVLTANEIVAALKEERKHETSEGNVRQTIAKLRGASYCVKHRNGRGYFRPDAPPPDVSPT